MKILIKYIDVNKKRRKRKYSFYKIGLKSINKRVEGVLEI